MSAAPGMFSTPKIASAGETLSRGVFLACTSSMATSTGAINTLVRSFFVKIASVVLQCLWPNAPSINWQGFAFFNYIPASWGQTTYRTAFSYNTIDRFLSKKDECHRQMIPPPHLLHHIGNRALGEILVPVKIVATRRWQVDRDLISGFDHGVGHLWPPE